jgi:DNA-binding CsgD family transcriptional regulator
VKIPEKGEALTRACRQEAGDALRARMGSALDPEKERQKPDRSCGDVVMKRTRIRCVKLLGAALTAEEQFTWALIAGGASNKEIAFQRGVTEAAVSKLLRGIFEKTGVRNRVKIALLWHGLDPDRALSSAASIARDNQFASKMEMAA